MDRRHSTRPRPAANRPPGRRAAHEGLRACAPPARAVCCNGREPSRRRHRPLPAGAAGRRRDAGRRGAAAARSSVPAPDAPEPGLYAGRQHRAGLGRRLRLQLHGALQPAHQRGREPPARRQRRRRARRHRRRQQVPERHRLERHGRGVRGARAGREGSRSSASASSTRISTARTARSRSPAPSGTG